MNTTKPNLSPDETVDYLVSEFGITREKGTLAKYRCQGGGPIFLRVGRAILYPRIGLDEWARTMLGEPMRSTSAVAVNVPDGLAPEHAA